MKLFNTTCITVLLYGCESWVITKAIEDKINSFATSCLRVMLGVKRTDRVPNTEIHARTETRPLVQEVITRQDWNFWAISCDAQTRNPSSAMPYTSHPMERGDQADNSCRIWNTFSSDWGTKMTLFSLIRLRTWHKTVDNGERSWSPALQPTDDDDEHLLYWCCSN